MAAEAYPSANFDFLDDFPSHWPSTRVPNTGQVVTTCDHSQIPTRLCYKACCSQEPWASRSQHPVHAAQLNAIGIEPGPRKHPN